MPTSLDFSKIKKTLIHQAKKLHYLTNDEVLSLIPEPEKYILEVDDLFNYLFDKGIDVFDKVESKEVLAAQTDKAASADLLELLSQKSNVDSVRMYLKEIGKISDNELETFRNQFFADQNAYYDKEIALVVAQEALRSAICWFDPSNSKPALPQTNKE